MERTPFHGRKLTMWHPHPYGSGRVSRARWPAMRTVLSVLAMAMLLPALLVLPGPAGVPWLQAADFGDPGARMRAYWLRGRLVVGVYPLANEGYIQIAERVMEKPEGYKAIAAYNKNRPVQTGKPVNFPIAAVKPVLRGHALRSLYPDDDLTERGWSHRVAGPLESLMQLTEAYTGSKGRFKELARYNKLRNPDVLPLGTEIVIPLHWIPAGLGFRPRAVKKPLALWKDPRSGRIFAAYKVRRNDTLYSLLLRFTDRERASELNRMSRLLLKINGVKGENRLKAGVTLRIPIEWISEERLVTAYKPRKPHRGNLSPRPAQPQTSRPRLLPPARPPPKRRAGSGRMHVIVDAGHGGRDPGAVYGRKGQKDHVYEHEVVYDVALRLQRLLSNRGHRVYPTIDDPARRQPVDKLSIEAMGTERVRVHPPYRIASGKVAVNMRIFLVNSLYRELTDKQGVDPANIVLISIHGDALAPTLRGTMVYYPDHRLRAGVFHPRGRVYRIRSEAVPQRIYFQRKHNRLAEEMSREFGEVIIRTFRENRLGVSRRKAVRSYYYRDGERTLPGVLRYSRVPTSVLVEVANLNNRADRMAMLSGKNRQRVARALALAVDNLRALRRKALRKTRNAAQQRLVTKKAS